MVNFYQRRKLKKYLYSPLTIVPLALIAFLLGSSVLSVYTKEQETRLKRDKQARELEALETRASALEAEIERLETERGREAEIRSKFEVAREGEQVIVIVEAEKVEAPPAPPPEKTWWQKFLSWF